MKFSTVWEKMSENLRGYFFDSHCIQTAIQLSMTICDSHNGNSSNYSLDVWK